MIIRRQSAARQAFVYLAVLGCWAAVPLMAALTLAGRSRRLSAIDDGASASGGNGHTWFVATLVMVAAIVGMITVVTVDAILALQESRPMPKGVHWIGYATSLSLAALLWLFGGIASIFATFTLNDCGSGAASPCLDQPGPFLSISFKICLIESTPLLALMFFLGLRSSVCRYVAPALIAGAYLLAVHLRLPHMGFGDHITVS